LICATNRHKIKAVLYRLGTLLKYVHNFFYLSWIQTDRRKKMISFFGRGKESTTDMMPCGLNAVTLSE